MDIIIGDAENGLLVRDVLKKHRVSARLLARLKRSDNGISVNGIRVTVRHRLSRGDILQIDDFPDVNASKIIPVNLPLDIVYEDEYIIVADKPPYMPTHPSLDHYDDTLANALAYRYRDSGTPFVFRPVSRLDRNTSGLVTVAKTKYASSLLNTLMMNGGISKKYIAILEGTPNLDCGVIDLHIRRTPGSVITREVCGADAPGAERAMTEYKVLYSDGNNSIVAVSPITGRTHQIRVHFAHLGIPVFGDDLYGSKSAHIDRHALHASELSFVHPISNVSLNISSPLPCDMLKLVEELFPRQSVILVNRKNSVEPQEHDM